MTAVVVAGTTGAEEGATNTTTGTDGVAIDTTIGMIERGTAATETTEVLCR